MDIIQQFKSSGSIDMDALHRLCRQIDVKHRLPFPENQAEDFVAMLLAAFEKADPAKRAKYINTMLGVQDLAAITESTRQRVQQAFGKVCTC